MHPGWRGKVGSGILTWESGGLLSELGLMGLGGWAGFLRGSELIFEFTARTIFEENLFARLRVVQGLGGGLSHQTT